MLAGASTDRKAWLLVELSPIAQQAARLLDFVAGNSTAFDMSDAQLSAAVGLVSAQQVAVVRRAIIEAGLAEAIEFQTRLKEPTSSIRAIAANLVGIATYIRYHRDRDDVRLVITEPGTNSALRREIDRRHGLAPLLFQTTDAFINLARSARAEFIVLVPFIDDEGAELLVTLFSLCASDVRRCLICRPLRESHCGPAFLKRRADFRALKVEVYEYSLPAILPSGRETFHAKVVLVDAAMYYVGSSNFMGSALDRSLECGVIVRGDSGQQLHAVVDALRSVATPFEY